MEGIKEFLSSSTIHGLVYVANTGRLTRILWILVVSIGFTCAGVIIQKSFSSWAVSPVTTTLESHPLTDLAFPSVTVCPPRDSFTSLNRDLSRLAENFTIDPPTKNALIADLPSVIFDSDFNETFSTFSRATNLSLGWYLGYTSIAFISRPLGHQPLPVVYQSSALAETVSSPFFEEPFDIETFEKNMLFRIEIYKPKKATSNTKIEIKIEFDTDNEKFIRETPNLG